MNQLEYLPGIGGAPIQLDGPVAFVGTAENLRGREWNFDLGYRDLVNANRPARVVDVTLWTDADTANAFRRVADADVMAKTPGTLIAQGEWKQACYILEAKPRVIHYGDLEIELKVALLEGAWWRMPEVEFLPEETPVTEYGSDTGEVVNVTGAVETPLHALTVYGRSVQDGTPTSSAPVAIQVVGGENLLSLTPYRIGNTFYNLAIGTQIVAQSTAANITVLDNNGAITIATTASWIGAIFVSDKLAVGSTYQMSYLNLSASGSCGRSFYTLDADHKVVRALANTTATSQSSFEWSVTIENGEVYLACAIGVRGTAGNITFDSLMVVPGTVGNTYVQYIPFCLAVTTNGATATTPIDLKGNVLASLPDGTKDELTVDSEGIVSITKRVAYTNKAVTDGITGSVGVDVLSSTGEIADNADVYYKTAETTISLDSITMPNVEDGSYANVTANDTPIITVEWVMTSGFFLDYPHNFAYDFSEVAAASSVESSVLTPSDVHLVIFGPATNPYILVGSNKYQVNVTVPSGGYLTVDGREKTIVLTLADGTTQNAFSYGVRGGGQGGGTYIFEPIQPGTQEVTYSGTFGFNLGWYEEEGEPPWISY